MTTSLSVAPNLFVLRWAAWSAFALIVAQFALAGGALFVLSPLWAVHGAIGMAIIIPIAVLLLQSRPLLQLAGIRGMTWSFFVLYLLQILLAALSDEPGFLALRAAHVANSALVLLASFGIALRTISVRRDSLGD